MPNYVVYLSTAKGGGGFCVVNTERFLERRQYFQVPDSLSVEEIVARINGIKRNAEDKGITLDSILSLVDYLNSNANNNGFGKLVVKTGASIDRRAEKDEELSFEDRSKNRRGYREEMGEFRGRKWFYR